MNADVYAAQDPPLCNGRWKKRSNPPPDIKGPSVRKQTSRYESLGPPRPRVNVGKVARLCNEGSALFSTARGGAGTRISATLKFGGAGERRDVKLLNISNLSVKVREYFPCTVPDTMGKPAREAIVITDIQYVPTAMVRVSVVLSICGNASARPQRAMLLHS